MKEKVVTVVTHEGERAGSVAFHEDRIAVKTTGEAVRESESVILPAMVDIGVMLKDRKLRGSTVENLVESAKRNGFDTVVLSGMNEPKVDDEITLEFIKSQAEAFGEEVTVLPMVVGAEEEKLNDCATLLQKGAVGIEFQSALDGNLLRRLMEYASAARVPLFCHPDDPALSADGFMHEGRVAASLGLGGVTPLAEISQVARVRAFAEFYGVTVVMLGISTVESLKECLRSRYLIPQVSIHHLVLTDEICEGYNTAGKIWPVLRDEKSRSQMLEMIAAHSDEVILTSLHSPVSDTAKDAVFAEAAYGIDGFEGFLPLVYEILVKKGSFTWPQVAAMTSANPRKALGLEPETNGYIFYDMANSTPCNNPRSPYYRRVCRGDVTLYKGSKWF